MRLPRPAMAALRLLPWVCLCVLPPNASLAAGPCVGLPVRDRLPCRCRAVPRMQLGTLRTRKLEGEWGITLQTDPGQVRAKRVNPAHAAAAVEVPVYQDFNPEAFHFGKARPVETLFRLDIPPTRAAAAVAAAAAAGEGEGGGADAGADGEAKGAGGEAPVSVPVPPHAVLANISPLMICHSLLCLYVAWRRAGGGCVRVVRDWGLARLATPPTPPYSTRAHAHTVTVTVAHTFTCSTRCARLPC